MNRCPQVLISPGTDPEGAEFRDPSVTLSYRYSEALRAAGAVPWVLPPPLDLDRRMLREAIHRVDGVILSGGNDVQPKHYTSRLPGSLRKTVSPPDTPRDLHELALIAEVFAQRKPLLAICRGHQLLNVALGGTLIIDIRSQIQGALNHARMDRKDSIVHKVTLTPDSTLSKMTGRKVIGVNSTHHQAVGKVAQKLKVVGRSLDGVVEALELAPAERGALPFLLAVQFHPERLLRRHPEYMNVFRAFVRSCKAKRRLPV